MKPEKTQVWLTLAWNDERLQSLCLARPRSIWLGEDGDLVVPQDAIGAPRVLLLTHGDGHWLHPDGRALSLGEVTTRYFGDFVVEFQLGARESRRLPLAWPRELAQLGLALLGAILLVAMPLWLGSQQTRRHLQHLMPEQKLAAIVPLPAIVGDQVAPQDVPPDAEPARTTRQVEFPPEVVLVPVPHIEPSMPPVEEAAKPSTPPQPSQGKTPDPQPRPRQSSPRLAYEDSRHALDAIDQLGTPTAGKTRLFGDPHPGAVETQNGTDLPHAAELAATPRRPTLADNPTLPDQRPRKERADGEPDLTPTRQDVVQVRSPRVEVVEGNGLDADTVHTYIQRMHGQLRHCLELGMLGSDKLNGRVRVAFVIAPDGSVLQARVEESGLHQPETEQCIAERIRAWQFPAATSGLPTRVRHGFVFRTK